MVLANLKTRTVRTVLIYGTLHLTGFAAHAFCVFQSLVVRPFVRKKGAYHADHVHEGALVSGVYYASVPSGSAPLVLRRPKANENQQTKNDDYDDQVSDVIISPAEGNLILFPPWVEHGVPLAAEQQDKVEDSSINHPRVSFAFNVTGAVVLGNDPWSVTRLKQYDFFVDVAD